MDILLGFGHILKSSINLPPTTTSRLSTKRLLPYLFLLLYSLPYTISPYKRIKNSPGWGYSLLHFGFFPVRYVSDYWLKVWERKWVSFKGGGDDVKRRRSSLG
ncbi:hypothetical protein TrLO_g168 [Triparma laevis f. longispina]|uniref:Uncharacterized protein n=1 Tax=Triparma laevis f. longispina TaxID=1714387 RepID=A0A9W6ZLC0_9STRA|nr:hypothetical protein TrLO_g168 [Triparma laevis f. longispina]